MLQVVTAVVVHPIPSVQVNAALMPDGTLLGVLVTVLVVLAAWVHVHAWQATVMPIVLDQQPH